MRNEDKGLGQYWEWAETPAPEDIPKVGDDINDSRYGVCVITEVKKVNHREYIFNYRIKDE